MTNPNTQSKQCIYFPKSWDDMWSTEDLTDVEKARGILFDLFTSFDGSDTLKRILWESVFFPNPKSRYAKNDDIYWLASALQSRVFGYRHSSFQSNLLVDRMRFILIKCLPNLPQTLNTDRVRHFYFDPSIAHSFRPSKKFPSDNLTALELPKSRVKIVIVGGGPTGLSAAINLAERVRCRERVQIHVFDKRWMNQKIGTFHFTVYPEDKRRRDQVITLQDHVKNLFSRETRKSIDYGLGKRGAELVWPESSNLQISKVEDALLKRAQDSIFDGMIHLHGADINDEKTLLNEAGDDFHLLLAADGANSWIRRDYFSKEEEQCGTSFALGIALDRGKKGLPHPQALNIFLTLSQTRFLLNASDRDSAGYLNVLLTEQEYDECISMDGTPADFRSPACILQNGSEPPGFTRQQIFAPYHRKSPLWQTVKDGLHLFGFVENDVKSIARIPINLIGVKSSTKEESLNDRAGHSHFLVSLAGDAALTHHFWPGRGMNSGIKSAIAWSNQVSDIIIEGNRGLVGLRARALNPYSDFMKKLRVREHDHRSFVILNTSGSSERMEERLGQAEKLQESTWQVDPVLCKTVLEIAARLEGRGKPRWHHEKIKGLRSKVFEILGGMSKETKAQMKHSGPWPTEKMSAAEVLPPEPRTKNLPSSMASCATDALQISPILVSPYDCFAVFLINGVLGSDAS